MKRLALLLLLPLGALAAPPGAARAAEEAPGVEVRNLNEPPLRPASPAWFRERGDEPATVSTDRPTPVAGRAMATPERALAECRVEAERLIHRWLAPDVPLAWPLPEAAVDALTLDHFVGERHRDDGYTVYEAGLRLDLTPARRAVLVRIYEDEVVGRRLAVLAGVLAFVLVCLGALAGYIRADEATRGYYTNHLRLAAAAGVGAAGAAIYFVLS